MLESGVVTGVWCGTPQSRATSACPVGLRGSLSLCVECTDNCVMRDATLGLLSDRSGTARAPTRRREVGEWGSRESGTLSGGLCVGLDIWLISGTLTVIYYLLDSDSASERPDSALLSRYLDICFSLTLA